MRGYRETEQIGAGAAAEDRDCVAGCGKAPATSDGRSQYQYVTQQPLPLWQTLPCIFILGHVTYILPILGLHLATLATIGLDDCHLPFCWTPGSFYLFTLPVLATQPADQGGLYGSISV